MDKLPLLVVSSICNHIFLTPPNPPPKKEEQKKYASNAPITERGFTVLQGAAIVQKIIYLYNGLEALAILLSVSRTHPASVPAPIRALLTALPFPSSISRLGATLHTSRTFKLALLIQVAGTLFRYTAIRRLGRDFTFELAVRDGHKLATDGPYALVRHPSYTGGQIAMVGMLIAQFCEGSLWSYVSESAYGKIARVLACVYGVLSAYITAAPWVRVTKEDEVLRAEFGQEWEEWARRVPYRLYPFIW